MKYNDVIETIDNNDSLGTESPPLCSVCGVETIRTSELYWLCLCLHSKLIQAKYPTSKSFIPATQKIE